MPILIDKYSSVMEEPAPVWREWFIMASITFQHFATGVTQGYPAVLIPGITKNNSDIQATREEASWITASYSISSVVGYILLPAVQHLYGRKVSNIAINIIVLVSAIVIAFSTNVTSLLIGRLIQGFAACSMHLCCYVLGEYTHPKRRGYFTVLKMSCFFVGIFVCHSTMYLLTWRQMNWLVAVPSIFGALVTLAWPESPFWLAYYGRYEECEKSFTWMRGRGIKAKRELRELITAQREIRKLDSNTNFLRGVVNAFQKKDFLKPLAISVVFTILLQSSGCHYFLAFITEVMKKLTDDESKSYYFTMYFDLMKILAGLSSSILIRMFTRRTVVFYSGGSICVVLGLVCVTSFLKSRDVISVDWLTPSLLIIFNAFNHAGVLPVTIVLLGEIFPIKYKGLGASVNGVVMSLISVALLKVTLTMLASLDVYGTFGIYVFIILSCLICLYFILPETKDRTLQNIELGFMDIDIKIDDENVDAAMPLKELEKTIIKEKL